MSKAALIAAAGFAVALAAAVFPQGPPTAEAAQAKARKAPVQAQKRSPGVQRLRVVPHTSKNPSKSKAINDTATHEIGHW